MTQYAPGFFLSGSRHPRGFPLWLFLSGYVFHNATAGESAARMEKENEGEREREDFSL